MGLAHHGLGPKAMVNVRTHQVFLLAAMVTGFPIIDRLDQNPCEVIETGDWVKVDAANGIVEVTKKDS